MIKRRLLLSVALFTAFGFSLQAQKAYDGFNNGIIGSAADATSGWASGWVLTSGDGSSSIDNAVYKGSSTGKCMKTNGAYNLIRQIAGNFPDVAGNVYWFSFNINYLTPVANEPAVRGAAIFLINDESLKTWPFTDMLYMGFTLVGGADYWTIQTGWPNLTKPDGHPIANGETVNYVVKIVMSGNADPETIYCWINPDQTQADLDIAIAQSGATPLNNGIKYVFLNNFGGAGDLTNEVQYDEIRLGTSFADVKINPQGGSTVVSKIASSDLGLVIYPNPATGSNTTIKYNLKAQQQAKGLVYDMYGKEVSLLVDAKQSAGTQNVSLNIESLKPGVYVCKVQVGNNISTKSFVVK